ncbi:MULTISPECIES: anthranilate phosphoribosyltransferase [Metabacillus]|uniref:anthranilate phosphoribosyltransferase n=1 Tax=Metabacillus TaxID=2675233 RepID=UPI001B9C7404|nr:MULTISPECIES: anthranilate phosphoribosyltransferase [Metabacillus]MCM3410805.1 anthranilate phosphoribosyltransferase [Metabacillus litoralis]UGB29261.1 anthranilate phosphoribosyltransferase [Metabacillus sp. B2-18]UHA58109.1 anthranilate phosphoribosyltransferase [Metabacillus litoralis]
MMKELLATCIEGHTLTEEQAEEVMNSIMSGQATPSQIASLVSIMRLRGETVDELVGFTKSMKKHMSSINYDFDIVDTCGTGGDGSSTFNISTAAAIVASSLKVKVAKHGNRAVSSKSGSADVLEKLGVNIQTSKEEAIKSLDEKNMSFLFAPMFHSSMKHAVNPRKEIGFRTVFNLLGPLSNPANAKRQIIGVFSTNYAEKMAEALKRLGAEHVLLVTGRDGLDEISITTATDVVELKNGHISRYVLHPTDVGLVEGVMDEIQVQNSDDSAELIEKIFRGEAPESAENIVALNAGAALYVANHVQSLDMGVLYAKEAIKNGTALKQLKSLQHQQEENYA